MVLSFVLAGGGCELNVCDESKVVVAREKGPVCCVPAR